MSAGVKGLIDFVGYPVGAAPAGGFVGFIDFAGYPVGAAPTGGFVGFIDFVGYPVGRGAAAPEPVITIADEGGGGPLSDYYQQRRPKRRGQTFEELLVLFGWDFVLAEAEWEKRQ